MYVCNLCGFTTYSWKELQKHRHGIYSTTCEGNLKQARQVVEANEGVKQLVENISRAIKALEGLPVDFRLAKKLSDVQREIQAYYSCDSPADR